MACQFDDLDRAVQARQGAGLRLQFANHAARGARLSHLGRRGFLLSMPLLDLLAKPPSQFVGAKLHRQIGFHPQPGGPFERDHLRCGFGEQSVDFFLDPGQFRVHAKFSQIPKPCRRDPPRPPKPSRFPSLTRESGNLLLHFFRPAPPRKS